MPQLLAQRADAAYDCIRTFREAAMRRFTEGILLRQQNQFTSSVYLMGYSVEMAVKSAVFRLNGFTVRQRIALQDFKTLVKYGCAQYGLTQPRNLHDFAFWSLFLVQHRVGLSLPYADPRIAQEIVQRSHETYNRWRETLRYRTNVAYRHEVARVAENAGWFLDKVEIL